MTKNKRSLISDIPTSIGAPARRASDGAGYLKLEQFTKVSEAEVMKLHGVGPKALDIIRRTLMDQGLTFANGSETN